MPEPKLTEAEIADAKRLCEEPESMVWGVLRRGLMRTYLLAALAELEALRAERDTLRHTIEMLQLQVGPTDWGSNRPQRAERAASTGQAVPGILRQREPPRPQRRKRG